MAEGRKHVITGSRHHSGAKPSQGGKFSDNILCEKHEGITSSFDTYGVRFVREVNRLFHANQNNNSVEVPNPEPIKLLRFVLSCIWREKAADQNEGLESLGPYRQPLENTVFHGADAAWPLIVSRDRFMVRDHQIDAFGVHPYRNRFYDRNTWMFTACSVTFFQIIDNRGLKELPDWVRADRANPVAVLMSDPMQIHKVGPLAPILRNMSRRGQTP